MAVLLTGGTGKTARYITPLLEDAKIPYVVTSRNPKDNATSPTAKFDWLDNSTWDNAFTHSSLGTNKISAIYLVAPPGDVDAPGIMNSFIDYAVDKHGVKRFTLLGGSPTQKGDDYFGKTWAYLEGKGVEWAVLRPTWFMENLTENQFYKTIKDSSTIPTATNNNRIPFIATADIGATAFATLTSSTPHNKSYLLLGPDGLTYDDVAAQLTKLLGREIKHVKLTQEESRQEYLKKGVPEGLAGMLSWLEAEGKEDLGISYTREMEELIGRKATKFDDWLPGKKGAWD